MGYWVERMIEMVGAVYVIRLICVILFLSTIAVTKSFFIGVVRGSETFGRRGIVTGIIIIVVIISTFFPAINTDKQATLRSRIVY